MKIGDQDGVANLDAEVFLCFFQPIDEVAEPHSPQEKHKIRLAVTALLDGLPVAVNGKKWIYRRKNEIVYENKEGTFTATVNTLFQVSEGFTIADGIQQEKTFYIPVDIPFGDAIEALHTITEEESAILAANLTLRKGV